MQVAHNDSKYQKDSILRNGRGRRDGVGVWVGVGGGLNTVKVQTRPLTRCSRNDVEL